jgi:L-ascorbate oxidase
MRVLRRSSGNIMAIGAATLAAAVLSHAGPAGAANFVEPAVFASHNGVLDLMMVAKAKPIASLSFQPPGHGAVIHPTGWVYEVCQRPASGLSCPSGSGTVADYGGVRLALQPGDTLKVRFVNRLPKVDPNKLDHVTDPGEANLFRNPTNIHTHGLLTPARAATLSDPTFGDFVFVTVYNSANGIPVPQTTHQHGPIVMDTVDYKIPVPNNHPSGLLWFHPHVHGIALNQVVQGLAGLITIGSVGDTVRGDAVNTRFPDANVRHMLLKEIQVLAAGTVDFDSGSQPVANGEVLNQEDPEFCAPIPAAHELRQGSCPGSNNSPDDDFTGGKWYFTVSGQQFPTIPITAADGEIWRIASAAGSLSYDLQLVNDANQQPMVVQLIAIDGVAVHLPQDTPMDSMVRIGGGKFRVVPCPAAQVIGNSVPVCVNEVVMMPSSRVEMWVTYRDQNGRIVNPPRGASATLKNIALTMGSGDTWPAVDLAKVQFNQTTQRQFTSNQVVVNDSGALQPGGILVAAVPGATASALPAGCAPLPAGHRRRIFFGFANPFAESETFALGYEEVDQQGNPVPGTQKPGPNQLEQFDPSHNTVCLPLAPGQRPVTERWEMVQLATENHNFHLHQSRFIERTGNTASVIQDNFPLGVAVPDATIADQVADNQLGTCTVQQWRSGHCVSPPVVMDIPFSQLGEFVYHCHILEHEDGGMMAKIQVVPSPN